MASSAEVETSMARIVTKCHAILQVKGKEYTNDSGDRLEAFKEAASIATKPGHRVTQKQVLFSYMLKHITSINMWTGNLCTPPTRDQWDEKICDSINYLLLLSAMIDEELADKKPDVPRETGFLEKAWGWLSNE